uniref:PPM-type phosphatase domain-containing protein n=1 Tax=Arcella intermedia TaxID=1963864 RepID=A0A6B2L3A9_9EUKA
MIVPNKAVPTEDEHVRGVSKRLASGYADTIGQRKNMEDRITILGYFRSKEDEDYFALFDGHNGDGAAKYCAGRMHVRLRDVMEKTEGDWDPIKCFKEAFLATNTSLEKVISSGGTTAVVAFFKGAELFIANVGDSRAVISKNRSATRVTVDHKPDLPEEKARIEGAGGWVAKGGITGTLTVSRSLGDFSYQPFISCTPDVFGPFPVLTNDHELLILACDGLWDVVSDQEAVDIALQADDPEDAAVRLRDEAFKKNSKDNISVIVIFFPVYDGSKDYPRDKPERPKEKEKEDTAQEPNPSKTDKNKEKEKEDDRGKARRAKSGMSASKDTIGTAASTKKSRSGTGTRDVKKKQRQSELKPGEGHKKNSKPKKKKSTDVKESQMTASGGVLLEVNDSQKGIAMGLERSNTIDAAPSEKHKHEHKKSDKHKNATSESKTKDLADGKKGTHEKAKTVDKTKDE